MVRPRKELNVVQTFRAARIRTLDQLCQKMRSSRSTVLRRLDEHGYHSSYNHSGKFLTIDEVAEFDSRGLWGWNVARFSEYGSLKETVWHFVEDSNQGMTHAELAVLLGWDRDEYRRPELYRNCGRISCWPHLIRRRDRLRFKLSRTVSGTRVSNKKKEGKNCEQSPLVHL